MQNHINNNKSNDDNHKDSNNINMNNNISGNKCLPEQFIYIRHALF